MTYPQVGGVACDPTRVLAAQLRNEAGQRGIKGRSAMNKAELEQALKH